MMTTGNIPPAAAASLHRTRRGSVEGKAKVTDRVPPKMVFLPFHFGEASANVLTAAVIDPDSETPGYKVSAVRVEKV